MRRNHKLQLLATRGRCIVEAITILTALLGEQTKHRVVFTACIRATLQCAVEEECMRGKSRETRKTDDGRT